MSGTAEKSDPALWEKVKEDVTAGAKGGKKGQWSARKAQLAVAEYKKRGGGYTGARDDDNSLHQWTEEEWSTKSGKRSGDTGERYLPKEARAALSDKDYARTTARKRADTRKGKQFSAQPEDVAAKTAVARDHRTRDALYAEARRRGIAGRSGMNKAQLREALTHRSKNRGGRLGPPRSSGNGRARGIARRYATRTIRRRRTLLL